MVQLVLGAVNTAMTIPALYIVERFGRRLPLLYGAIWQSIWLLVFAAIGMASPPEENPVSGTVMIVAACMFIASFAVSWGPFAWLVLPHPCDHEEQIRADPENTGPSSASSSPSARAPNKPP